MSTLARFTLLALVCSLVLFAACGGDDDDDSAPFDEGGGDDDEQGDDDTFEPPELTEGFVLVPHGTFVMGSPESELGHRANEQQHTVTLTRDIEMLATEVTQELFQLTMAYDPSYFPAFTSDDWPRLPVERTSWYDALAFANRLSQDHGYDECYVLTEIECADETYGNTVTHCGEHGGIVSAEVALNGVDTPYACEGFRLPTEAEWEYAARAGTQTSLPYGETTVAGCEPIDPRVNDIGWYCGNAEMVTHNVATKFANPWGLYDMIGNVLEWTWDGYAADYGGGASDPAGPEAATFKVARGGSFRYYGGARCRSAYRAAFSLNYKSPHVGFRVVRTISDSYDDEPADDSPADDGGTEEKAPVELPGELPFAFTRPQVGDPLTPQEISDFTAKITAFFDNVQYFHWILWTGHGVGPDNPEGYPDYKLYWQDTTAIKEGDVVTFEHRGGADNLMIRTGKIFNSAAAVYLASGDPLFGRIVKEYSKGVTALFWGMLFAEEDPEHDLMPRALFAINNEYEEEGRLARVTYDKVRHVVRSWNAHTIPNAGNPVWGEDVWLRTWRSKDDVPHIMRMVPMLMRVVQDAPDEPVREAAAQALSYLEGFSRDIVDSGWYIRAKDDDGNAYVPLNDGGMVNDLASYDLYTVVDPYAECTNKVSAALVGYGDAQGVECGSGMSSLYESIAVDQHYFNAAIIRYFHIAALTNALIQGQNELAMDFLEGMAERADSIMYNDEGRAAHNEWDADFAGQLLAMATGGLPLTNEEARLVVEQYSLSVDHYEAWDLWDLWDDSVPDGTYEYKPSRNGALGTALREPEMTHILEYCYAPFRNPTGAQFVDCDIVLDPSRWGGK